MRPKQITTSEKQISQVTKVIQREYENLFGIHVNKEQLANVSSGVILDPDILESIFDMVNVGENRMEDFRLTIDFQRDIISCTYKKKQL